jgi:hypothetical protein
VVTNSVSDLVIVLAAVLLLAAVTRWVFRPSRPRTGRLPDAAESEDLGLLVVLSPGQPRTAALNLRTRLGQAGIRSSMSQRRDGSVDVLVFQQDVDRARELI